MIFPYDRSVGSDDGKTPRPTQRPASNSESRKREHPSGFSPKDGAFGQQLAGPDGVSDPHLDNGFAEVIRKAKAEAWNECAKEACDLGWMHEYGEQDVLERNPYGEAS